MSQPPYQPPQYPPYAYYPPPQPPKKHTAWWIILGIVIGIFSCAGCSLFVVALNTNHSTYTTTTSDSSDNSGTAYGAGSSTHVVFLHSTPTPTIASPWTTTHTFHGDGEEKTGIFSVSDDWKLNWTCDPSSFNSMQYNVIVTVYGSDNTMQDVAINTLCKYGNVSGSTEEHSGGSIYLDIDSESSWSLTIQELN